MQLLVNNIFPPPPGTLAGRKAEASDGGSQGILQLPGPPRVPATRNTPWPIAVSYMNPILVIDPSCIIARACS